MNIKISFRNHEHVDALEKQVHEKLARFERFIDERHNPYNIDVSIEFHKVHQHYKVSGNVIYGHYTFHAEREDRDVHLAINEVANRLYDDMQKKKEKLTDTRQHGCGKECKQQLYNGADLEESEE